MKKKDLLKRIEALEAAIESGEIVKTVTIDVSGAMKSIENAVKPKDETILVINYQVYVPDGILTDEMDIINGNHLLFFDDGWTVLCTNGTHDNSKPNQFKLVPVKREELKAGDVAFLFLKDGSCELKYELSNLECYVIVTEKDIVFWSSENGGIEVCNYKLNSSYVWYKVVEA